MKNEIAFLLGSVGDDILSHLPRHTTIFTNTLSNEAMLKEAGFDACYIYRNQDSVFDRSVELALSWLASLEQNANAAGKSAAELLGSSDLSPWMLSYDALFEIKGGIFDSILHLILAKKICAESNGAVSVFAEKDDHLANAILQILGSRADIKWIDTPAKAPPAITKITLRQLWQRADRLLIQPILVRIRCLWESCNSHNRVALVGLSGEMARVSRDANGRIAVKDVYYENLEPALDLKLSDLIKVGIRQPHICDSDFRNSLMVWRLIISGAFRPWSAYSSLADIFSVFRKRRHYRAVLQSGDREAGFKSLFTVDGLNFYSLLRPKLMEMLPGMFASAHFHYAIAERLVERENIKLIISVESFSNIGRCMAAALHRHGGKLWGIQGGIISPKLVTNSGFYVPALAGRSELMADLFFAWGKSYISLLQKFGIPSERLRMMGFHRAKSFSSSGDIHSKRHRVAYIAGGNPEVCPYLMNMEEEFYTLNVLSESLPPDTELIVRAHPRHDVTDFRRLLEGKENVSLLTASDMPIEDLISSADCVISKASTVLLEAAQAGCNVLLVNLSGTPDFTGFSAQPSGLPCATDSSSLQYLLSAILNNDKQYNSQTLKEFYANWCSGDAESATGVIISELGNYS